MTCDANSKNCMTRKCATCATSLEAYELNDSDVQLKYQQWENSEKVEITGTVREVFNKLDSKLTDILLHTYIKRCQGSQFNEMKVKCDGRQVMLQVDFSENATLMSQNEIESAHWNHSQVTLFTAHARITNEPTENESMVLISDNLNHTKHSLYVFKDQIFTDFKGRHKDINAINVFSDGASSQFKQMYLFSSLYTWEQHHVHMVWNFFATSHGKGVVDGLGGTVI